MMLMVRIIGLCVILAGADISDPYSFGDAMYWLGTLAIGVGYMMIVAGARGEHSIN